MSKLMLFNLPNAEGGNFNIAEHLPAVVYFYPKDNTPGCTTEAQEFSALLPQFTQLGYHVIGISRDTEKSHHNFICKYELNITLLSDCEETVCHQFGVLKEKNMYGKKVFGIERSTFILNQDGNIIHEWRKVKAAGHAQTVLDTLQQHA
ncbi:thiol peroxidase [Snodgrassella communis]|uniref:peroxiredoxin n=1 Tax=Snodgrassella communis TaxID=2946699 RepID=UPI000C1E524B|nr:peroxiredoxin [Snodgrassella communis]PIT24042.1 thiol peroxidase [Snodgrassella communis]